MIPTVRKTWHFDPAVAHSVHDLLSSLLEHLGNSALVLVEQGPKAENTILAVRAARAVDLATLPQAATLCHGYLKLRDRDIALVNDPSSGGTTLSDFTLVAGVCFETLGPGAELLIAKRLSFPPRISSSGRIDEEGVRVPPMPIANAGQLNKDILGAMSAHPLAPEGLAAAIESACADLLAVIQKFKEAARDPGSELRRTNFKRYIADCMKMTEDKLHHLPLGAKTASMRLPSGELLKLQLRIDETRITFDFAGTDPSTKVALTEMMTFGACLAVTASLFSDGLPMNAATFSMIQVSAPSRTFLSSQAPIGNIRSTRFAVAAVCDLARAAFAQLNTSLRAPMSPTASGHFQFEFENGKFWSGSLRPGSPARPSAPGLDSYSMWEPYDQPLDLDDVESRFPLKILGHGVRAGSGGKGLHRGGDGAFYSLEAREACVVRWALGASMQKAEGLEGGRAGQIAKIDLRRKGAADLESVESAQGDLKLAPGDQIHFFGAGGGGFGAPKEED